MLSDDNLGMSFQIVVFKAPLFYGGIVEYHTYSPLQNTFWDSSQDLSQRRSQGDIIGSYIHMESLPPIPCRHQPTIHT